MQFASSRHRKLIWGVWIAALLALYALTYHGFSGSVIDETMPLGVTAQLLTAHTVQLNPLYPALREWGAPASNPATPIYSKYPIGQSLVALPLYALGSLIPVHAFTPTPIGQPFLPTAPVVTVWILGSLTTILTAFGVVKATQALGYSARTGAWLALLFAVTTFAWPYAKTFYNEPSTACALIGTVYFSLRYRQSHTRRDGLLTGVCLGAAILFRTTSVIFIPITLLYLLPSALTLHPSPKWRGTFQTRCFSLSFGRGARGEGCLWLHTWIAKMFWPSLGIAVALALTLGYNLYRFGSLFETGYEPGFGRAPWEALIGYVLSPSRSIFLFAPILLLAIPGGVRLAKRLPREAIFLAALALAPVGIYAAWWAWDGGGSLGPRFLLPSVPVSILLVAPLIGRLRWRPMLIGLGVIGFGVQVWCNLATPVDVFGYLLSQRGVSQSALNWQLNNSYLINVWPAYIQNRIDSVALRLLPIHDPVLSALAFAALSTILASVLIWTTFRVSPAAVGASELTMP